MDRELIIRRLLALTMIYQRHPLRYWSWPSSMGVCSRCWRPEDFNAPRHGTMDSETSGSIPLCEDCWSALTPVTRVPYYLSMLENWAWREGVENNDITKVARCYDIIIAVLEGK